VMAARIELLIERRNSKRHKLSADTLVATLVESVDDAPFRHIHALGERGYSLTAVAALPAS
jgi:hypothetical protein